MFLSLVPLGLHLRFVGGLGSELEGVPRVLDAISDNVGSGGVELVVLQPLLESEVGFIG